MLVKAIMEGKPVTVKQFAETLNDPVVLKRFEMEVKEEKFNESAKNHRPPPNYLGIQVNNINLFRDREVYN